MIIQLIAIVSTSSADMQINFVRLNSQIIIERIFALIPVAFPNLKQIQIKGDDRYLPLAFHTEDLMAKSIDLIYNRFEKTRNLALKLILVNNTKRLKLIEKEHNRYLSIQFDDIEIIKQYLFPYEIKFDETYYFYYDEKGHSNRCSNIHIDDYLFENYLIQLDQSVVLKHTAINTFVYSFRTIINDLNADKLVRILVFYIAKRFEQYTNLNQIQLSSLIEWDQSVLKENKILKFSLPNLNIKGEINPVLKQIKLSI